MRLRRPSCYAMPSTWKCGQRTLLAMLASALCDFVNAPSALGWHQLHVCTHGMLYHYFPFSLSPSLSLSFSTLHSNRGHSTCHRLSNEGHQLVLTCLVSLIRCLIKVDQSHRYHQKMMTIDRRTEIIHYYHHHHHHHQWSDLLAVLQFYHWW